MKNTMTAIAPLEYVVIRIPEDQFNAEILPALVAIQKAGSVQVVDVLFVARDDAGTLTTREVHELAEEELGPYGDLEDSLKGLLTAEDIATLAADLHAAESAVIVLLEHTWTQKLGEAVARAGGTPLAVGLVSPDALVRLDQELAALPARQPAVA